MKKIIVAIIIIILLVVSYFVCVNLYKQGILHMNVFQGSKEEFNNYPNKK